MGYRITNTITNWSSGYMVKKTIIIIPTISIRKDSINKSSLISIKFLFLKCSFSVSIFYKQN